MSRRRNLDAEERALWRHVTQSIRPLKPEPAAMPPVETAAPDAEPAAPQVSAPRSKPVRTPVRPVAPPPTPLAPLEPKLRRRLSRGGSDVDARLDLHGLTQAVAHQRLRSFLAGAQGQGHALVLVITGKGNPYGADASEGRHVTLAGEGGRGVLRRLVPQWLAAPEMRMLVVGFETAARGHGGEGALYVRIRRVRERRP
ncbi:Smr/MutS family protein [Bosea sp. 117]|uniref:Smr/MutS family protein n=1 Tax=Bosea sp. 117 TaxID=1125973 RepID=UPI0004943FBC|nr:Smr/MutS family protein [Bosea sp. 117]